MGAYTEGERVRISRKGRQSPPPKLNKAFEHLIMSIFAAAICIVLAYLTYRDGQSWQIPVWLGMAAVLVAIPLLPQTRNDGRALKASRWIVVAVAVGFFVAEMFRRNAG